MDIHGHKIIIGADGCKIASTPRSAHTHSQISDNWSSRAKLILNDREVGDCFGYSIAIHYDTVVVGSE